MISSHHSTTRFTKQLTYALTEMSKPSYNRSGCCWNCKAPGHRANQCTQKRKLFCSYCLKEGTTTLHCSCRSTRRTITMNKPLASNNWKKYPECPDAYRASEAHIWIRVGDKSFRTYKNTAKIQTEVGWLVATKASLFYVVRREFIRTETGIISETLIPFCYQNTIRTIRCRITDEPAEEITFGTDALRCFGFQAVLANQQCINLIGCPPISHQSVYDIPLIKSIEKIKRPKRCPIVPKNPLNLDLSQFDEPMEAADTPISPDNLEESSQAAELSWEAEMLKEINDEFEIVNDEEIMAFNDA
ncbi:hypothetical protein ACFFRR_005235 [Megaselia abdita]